MTDQKAYLYEVSVDWLKGREGELKATNLSNLPVSSPPEFNGSEGIWTPEHLYIASVNSCFMLTFLAIAEGSKLEFLSFSCSAEGKMEKAGSSVYQFTEITLKPKLMVRNSNDLERASRILEKAERNCFISNSIKTSIKLEPEIKY